MGAGANIGSAVTGFGRGLTNALLYNRQRNDQKKREEQARLDREFQMMLPMHLQLFQETGDPTGLEAFVGQHYPEMAKGWKKNPPPWTSIMPLLGPAQAPEQAGGVVPTGMTPPPTAQVPTGAAPPPGMTEPAVLPSRPAVSPQTPPAARKTLFGIELPTEEEKLAKRATQISSEITAQDQGKIDAARRMVATGAAGSMAEALDRVGLRSAQSAGTPPQPGSIGNMVVLENQQRAAKGLPPMNAQEVSAFVVKQQQAEATAQRGFGVDREAISMAMFHKSFGELQQAEQQAVITEEQNMLQKEGAARALGTAEGRFQAPADLKTAQETGVTVGTTAAQVAGQEVPTQDVNARRRSLDVLKQDIARVQSLIEVLPTENALGGTAPGAWLAVRKRMNSPSNVVDPATGQPLSYRAAIAQLQSVVDSMVNVLARSRGEQRGTQTERDAERAYSAVVNLQAGLTDPFGGDTRESAAARLKEAIEGIDRVIAGLPAQPVPKAGAGAQPAKPGAPPAPAGGSTGFKMDAKGNILDAATGNVVVPVQ